MLGDVIFLLSVLCMKDSWQAGVPGRDEISKKSVLFCDIFQFLQNYKNAVAKLPQRCCI